MQFYHRQSFKTFEVSIYLFVVPILQFVMLQFLQLSLFCLVLSPFLSLSFSWCPQIREGCHEV